MHRAGLWTIDRLASDLGRHARRGDSQPGAGKYRSAEEMSRLAQFVDQASWSDPTNHDNTFLSYYTWGAAIGLGLDLSLRARTDHKVTLDDYMRRLWRDFGRVDRRGRGRGRARRTRCRISATCLPTSSGDRAVCGSSSSIATSRDARSSTTSRCSRAPGWSCARSDRAARGSVRSPSTSRRRSGAHHVADDRGHAAVSRRARSRRRDAVVRRSSRYHGPRATGRASSCAAVRATRCGCRSGARGARQDVTIAIAEDPRLHVVPAESTGRPLTAAERAFRDAWLGSKQ